jgi:hypothetical protein
MPSFSRSVLAPEEEVDARWWRRRFISRLRCVIVRLGCRVVVGRRSIVVIRRRRDVAVIMTSVVYVVAHLAMLLVMFIVTMAARASRSHGNATDNNAETNSGRELPNSD